MFGLFSICNVLGNVTGNFSIPYAGFKILLSILNVHRYRLRRKWSQLCQVTENSWTVCAFIDNIIRKWESKSVLYCFAHSDKLTSCDILSSLLRTT